MIDSLSFRKDGTGFRFDTLTVRAHLDLLMHNFHISYTGKGHIVFH